MKYQTLAGTQLNVSKICLGTMTYGEQNSEKEAHQQLDFAIEKGINFIDTAEMYPVPPKQETQGLTEQYIGSWLKKSRMREKVVLATKVAGPQRNPYIRENMALDHRNINDAINDSLQRLQTDYIDLYQLHWPQRETNCFGKLNYQYSDEASDVSLLDTLEVLDQLVKAGKIRHIGVSNETPWGLMSYLALAEKHNLPKMVSIQNPYSLLNRSFEIGLAEISQHEEIGLLAYSPMAFGALSGKYINQQPADARCTLYPRFSRYFNEQGKKATEAYVNLAREFNISPAQMSLAFVNQRPFVASNIIGATTMAQLDENIESINLTLSDELMSEIEKIGVEFSNPCP
ncbi:NADP(H)-dependent aldo-keto reductase [Vibrio sp. SS-MA-C1-2]|uniref:NADP(H)-dependent aldo-keto reductase n=1 Tax=Vibrio sp. SS-MA-C1-2 TaxID=2908646 RepID=UPI001F21717B|nr:NADP(H)-dependent aldo-keto reductase [Vibrio sp. SS-MA-C1-2]UJF19677.1 NADP(H)-dependent aldo-keto reductase [Vibrio sp. SS-MA-C1-2]